MQSKFSSLGNVTSASSRCVLATALTLLLTVASFAESPLPRKPNNGGVYVVAHRGAHDDGRPENTLAAYQRAIDLGCDFVEIDVRKTKDGRYVSVHNSEIDAYTNGAATGQVKDFTLEELKALDIGSHHGEAWADAKIPTLEEILDLCHGKIGIYLDLKYGEFKEIADIVAKHDMSHDVIWYAGGRTLLDLAEYCPDCWPMPDPGPEKNIERLVKRHEPKVIAAVWRHYSKSFVEKCHAAGAIVIVDESDPSCWEDAIAWDSDGVQTDHPEEFIAFLKQKE